jgi:hypothetical protein
MKPIIFTTAICLLFVMGCKSSTTSPSLVSTITKKGGIPFSVGWAGTNYAATFQLNNINTNYPDGLSNSSSEAIVYLWDSTSNVSVSGGTVSINSTSVPSIDHSADGGGVYYQLNTGNSQTVPILYNGSSLAFNVAGTVAFPALTDTINYVNRQMALTAPATTDSLSASTGFTISWNHNSGSTNTVVVELIGDTSYYQTTTTNNGSFTVTPTMLTGFSTGSTIEVSVMRMNYKEASDTYGRNYVMANYSTELDYHPLNP